MMFRRTMLRQQWIRLSTFARLCVAIACLGAAVAAAQAPALELAVETDFGDSYRAGTEHELRFSIRLEDPRELVEQGVLFLNVVEIDRAGRFPQAMHKVFESATGAPDIFRIPFDGSALRAGLDTAVSVRLRRDAPAGDYALVFQVFEGEETDPHRVEVENRVAMESFSFTIQR